MSLDNLRQDIRLAIRGLLRAPAFAAVTILTLALGIGANTAIFSIVNGVILRPLGYPKPEQLMYLTTQFPAFGFDRFWVSPPEYFEFREMNQSFAVGRRVHDGRGQPHRRRSAAARAIGVGRRAPAERARHPAACRPVVRERRDRRRAAAESDRSRAAAADLHPLVRALAKRVRRTGQHHRTDGRGQRPAPRGDRHHAAGRGRDGQPHRDLDADRPQPGQPPAARQPFSLSRRAPEGRRDAGGGAVRS